jgi:serine/threonine-protein kinase
MFEGNAATVIGRRVGNYVVERTLAQGGMGSVFVARHPALGREAAVKFLGQDQEAPPELTKRFLDEARITAALRHPNIIDIFDFGELDGRLYYVMELLEGRDLSALMRARRRFAWPEVVDCLEQVCSGLAAAHAVGVVHRDLKPGNIFVVRGEPPRLKLMDFGVAKIMTTQGEQTRYGQIIGTPRYMSPEQALGQIDRISPQSDFYSLGVIAYEMLTGSTPFEHESPVMLLVMHVRDAVKPLDELVDGIPRQFSRLIEACLAKDPAARPESAQAILDGLAELRRSCGLAADDVAGPTSITLELVPDDPQSALAQPQTCERFVDADTVLGTPEAPALTPAVEIALEVLSSRKFESVDLAGAAADAGPSKSLGASASNGTDVTRASEQQQPLMDVALGPGAGAFDATFPAMENNAAAPDRDSGARIVQAPPAAAAAQEAPERNSGARIAQAQPPAGVAQEAFRLVADAPESTSTPSLGVHTVNLTDADRNTLNRLLLRMQRRGDFPAFVQNVGEVSKRADFEASFSAQQLGASILKDYALTAKLLRIVNSAYASRFGGKIYSIQHAIVILGFERVRSLALSTSLFKNQGKKEHSERISESAINSLVSGEIARQLHLDADLDDPEQATVCSMFRNLGKHLVLVYLPEVFDQIVTSMAQEGLSLNVASERVLGISLHKIGVGIAERWRLPPKMITAMSVIPERTGKPKREEDKLAALAEFSNQLCEIVASEMSEEQRDAALKTLTNRHKNLIQLEPEELIELLKSTQLSFEQRYATLLGNATKTCRFARTVATLSGATPLSARTALEMSASGAAVATAENHEASNRLALDQPTPAVVAGEAAAIGGIRERGKPQIARLQLVKRAGAEPAEDEAVTGNATLDVAAMQALKEWGRSGSSDALLSTLLRAVASSLDVPRILALRATVNRKELVVVGGVGDDSEGLAKEFRLPLSSSRTSTDPFSVCYHSGRDFIIEDVFSPKAASTLPQRYYEAIGSTCLGLVQCSEKGLPALVLMIDCEPPRKLPTSADIAKLAKARAALVKIAPNITH